MTVDTVRSGFLWASRILRIAGRFVGKGSLLPLADVCYDIATNPAYAPLLKLVAWLIVQGRLTELFDILSGRLRQYGTAYAAEQAIMGDGAA